MLGTHTPKTIPRNMETPSQEQMQMLDILRELAAKIDLLEQDLQQIRNGLDAMGEHQQQAIHSLLNAVHFQPSQS